MNINRIIVLVFFVFSNLIFISCKVEIKKSDSRTYTNLLKEIDGPYIYDKKDSLSVITVKKDGQSKFFIHNEKLKKTTGQKFICVVNNIEKDSFSFVLKDKYLSPKAVYDSPEKLFVTSDIEGNFDAFYSLLVANKVMDKNYNWTFGTGHLVIAGDMVDRGNNAWPCLWLLYKLEQEAEKFGGVVHYILGNHDIMNMHANLRYVKKRYIELAKILSGKEDEKEAYLELLSDTNELAKWIASKNTIEKIGDNIYLHGGISEDVVDADLTIEKMNEIVRKNIRKDLTNNPGNNELDNLVYSRLGPFWYRGLVIDYKEYYKKMKVSNLDQILNFYGAKRIVVGHTIVDEKITSDFNGKIIRVDIKHEEKKFSGKSEALLIIGEKYFKVNDSGERAELSMD